MESEEETENQEVVIGLKHQFGKMMLATAAGFIASKLVERAYDNWLESKLNDIAEIQQ